MCVFAAISAEFAKYMATFKPFLILALKNFAEHQVQFGSVHGALRHFMTSPPLPLRCAWQQWDSWGTYVEH